MIKPLQIIGGAALTGVLVGCASTPPADTDAGGTVTQEVSAAATAEDEQPPGFYINGEFVEIGPATEEDKTQPVINFCDVLTDDMLLEIGANPGYASTSEEADFAGCGYLSNDGLLHFIGFNTSWNRKSNYAERGYIIDDNASEIIPGAFTHRMDDLVDTFDCQVSVETSRGTVLHSFEDSDGEIPRDKACDLVVENLENMFTSLQGE